MENQRKNFVFHTKCFGKQMTRHLFKKKPWETKDFFLVFKEKTMENQRKKMFFIQNALESKGKDNF